MNYEILNIFDPNAATWPEQKERLNRVGGKLITLQPDPGTFQKQQQGDVEIINVIDFVTKRVYHPDEFMFFNQAPVVDGAEIFMNGDWSIDVIKDGNRIGSVHTYANSRRLVNNVTYFNQDGSKDFIEEYTYDGGLFSRLYYEGERVQQIVFYNNDKQPVVTFYFYDGAMNLITVEDPKTHEIVEKYDNMNDFLGNTLPKIVTENDNVGILYLGIELTSLSLTKSKNSLYMVEPPLDENGNIRGNLGLVLNNDLQFIKYVVVNQEQADQIKKAGVPTEKLIVK